MTIGLPALLRHELHIVRNKARAAFARKRDWVPLLIGAPLLIAALAQGLRGASSGGPLGIRLVFALIAIAGFAGHTAILRRLDHLRTESVMAKAALQPRVSLVYAGVFHSPLAVAGASSAALAAPDGQLPTAILIACLAYGGAVVSATLAHRLGRLASASSRRLGGRAARLSPRLSGLGSQRARVAELLVRRVGVGRLSVRGNCAAFLAWGGGAGFLHLLLKSMAPGQAAEVVSGAILLLAHAMLGRQHPPLWRYLLALGVRPAALALLPALPASSLLAGFIAVLAAAGAVPLGALTAGGAIILLLFAFLCLMRTLHYATKSRAHADLAFQVDLVAMAVAGFLTFLLVPAVAAARLWQLRQQADRSRWLLR